MNLGEAGSIEQPPLFTQGVEEGFEVLRTVDPIHIQFLDRHVPVLRPQEDLHRAFDGVAGRNQRKGEGDRPGAFDSLVPRPQIGEVRKLRLFPGLRTKPPLLPSDQRERRNPEDRSRNAHHIVHPPKPRPE
jgi:hypothetical protein